MKFKMLYSCTFLIIIFFHVTNAQKNKSFDYKSLVGKQYFNIEEITDEVKVGGGIGIVVCENRDFGVSIYTNKNDTNKKYIVFEKAVNKSKHSFSLKILDVIEVNLSAYGKGSSIWQSYCKSKKLKLLCDPVAIYYHDTTMAKKKIWVKPEKCWLPNPKSEKLEEISQENIQCSSPEPAMDMEGLGEE